MLANLQNPNENHLKAIEAFENALEIFNEKDYPSKHKKIMSILKSLKQQTN